MFGMIFEEIFGSTVMEFGGDTVYVFIALIVLSDKDGYIRQTPAALARRIGKDVDDVKRSLANLSEPDPDSNSSAFDGRRIIPLAELTNGTENRGYFVINKEKYANLGNRSRRAALTTARTRSFRERKKTNIINEGTPGNAREHSGTEFLHIDTDVDVDTDTDTDTDKKNNGAYAPVVVGLDVVAWKRWANYRTKIRKPLKPASIQAAQRKLAAFGSDQAAAVEHSIANGWQGLFAPDKSKSGRKTFADYHKETTNAERGTASIPSTAKRLD